MVISLVVSEAVGFATTDNRKRSFNDLQQVANWPAHQYIKKVTAISVCYSKNPSKVIGIEVTYHVTTDKHTATETHGVFTENYEKYSVGEDESFVGMNGSTDDNEEPTLRQLGFLTYNNKTGSLTTHGPVPKDLSGGLNVKGFVVLGLIIGFSGSKAENDYLETLSVYKAQPGASFNLHISAVDLHIS